MAENYGEEFEALLIPEINHLPKDWNVAPTKEIYIIKQNNGHRELENAYWGMIAPWSKDFPAAYKSQANSINARSESVAEKPTFRNSFRFSRCLIPATGYYEWATELGPYKTKQPFYITNQIENKSLAFTGIYANWVDPITKKNYQSAALLTKPAVGFLATVHSRMPLFLKEDLWDSWLNPDIKDPKDVRELISQPLDDSFLLAKPVSDRVNSIRNNDEKLILPIDLDTPETLF